MKFADVLGGMKLDEILGRVKLQEMMSKVNFSEMIDRTRIQELMSKVNIHDIVDRVKLQEVLGKVNFREMNERAYARLVEKFPRLATIEAPSRTTSMCIAGGGVAVLLVYYSRTQSLRVRNQRSSAESTVLAAFYTCFWKVE